MAFFAKIFGSIAGAPSAQGVPGYRAYAVGDIHGRLDLLDELLAKIEADIAARRRSNIRVIFLGDLIDRGPQSAGVVERLSKWRPPGGEAVFLSGNHEEVLLRILRGEPALLGDWLKYGGAECLRSYGLPPTRLRGKSESEALAMVKAAIPVAHQQFLASFADTFRFGDYLFVHAGIRPGVGMAAQVQQDLRWIRHPFLDDATDHGFIVVHGHSISDGIDERPNRIGLDTGAYRSGVLTAMAVEGSKRWFLDTSTKE